MNRMVGGWWVLMGCVSSVVWAGDPVRIAECLPADERAWVEVSPKGLVGSWTWHRLDRRGGFPRLSIPPVVVPAGSLDRALRLAIDSAGGRIPVFSGPGSQALMLDRAARVGGELSAVAEVLGALASADARVEWDPVRGGVEVSTKARYVLQVHGDDAVSLSAAVLRGVGVHDLAYGAGEQLRFRADPEGLERASRVLLALAPHNGRIPARGAVAVDLWIWHGFDARERRRIHAWWGRAGLQARSLWRGATGWTMSLEDFSAATAGFPLAKRVPFARRIVVPEGLGVGMRVRGCMDWLSTPSMPWLSVSYLGSAMWQALGGAHGGELSLRMAVQEAAEGPQMPQPSLGALEIGVVPGGTVVAFWPGQDLLVWSRMGWRLSPGWNGGDQ